MKKLGIVQYKNRNDKFIPITESKRKFFCSFCLSRMIADYIPFS